ncbi:hypothetical protein JQR88_24570 (plasmid) [Pseudomonas luteola]|jgi:hypothetical protein|uniref:hypothetical protein n=1 Tax=Pseudomonas luteola TaxID=47886 RepID=UPI003DA147B5
MRSLKEQLAALSPPLTYELLDRGDVTIISIIDPSLPAKVERSLEKSLLNNNLLLYVVIRDAVDELRRLGGYPPVTTDQISADG